MKSIYVVFMFVISLYAQEYKLGRGVDVYEDEKLSLTLGGHLDLNTHLQNNDDTKLEVGQAGIMLFGQYTPKIHFLAEIGSDDIFTYNLSENNSKTTTVQLMRLYAKYLHSDALSIKVGQFLTPIGIWNKTYIPALRWSAFTPYVAQGFFPKIIAGASLDGDIFDDRTLSYSVFYHVDGEHDTNDNNVKAKEFIGGEFRYHYSSRIKFAVPYGSYYSESSKEDIVFSGFNFILPFKKNELSSEFLYKKGKWKNTNGFKNSWKDYAYYLQYVQHIYNASYLSFRYGEQRRVSSANAEIWEDKNSVLGYVYRPRNSFSTKLEYRHRERAGIGSVQSDEGLLSFSVLF